MTAASMPPQCWVPRLNSALSPGPAPMPVACSNLRAKSICVSVTNLRNSAVAAPPTAPAARPRRTKPLMPEFTAPRRSVTGEAERMAPVMEELVDHHPVGHDPAVLLQHHVAAEQR